MGTLRYISPEQVRGRVDHRSDIFSVGAVFYEFLSLRPPFTGEDPMQLLEQLRTEEPPPLERARCRRSRPSWRRSSRGRCARIRRSDSPTSSRCGGELEEMQRGLTEEAPGPRARPRASVVSWLQLRAALAERLGAAEEDERIPPLDERGRLATIQALERDLAERIEAVQARSRGPIRWRPPCGAPTTLLQAGRVRGSGRGVRGHRGGHAGARAGGRRCSSRRAPKCQVQRRRQLAAELVRASPGRAGRRTSTPSAWRFSSRLPRFHRPTKRARRSRRCARRRKLH